MHLPVAFQILFLAFLSFFKPEKSDLMITAKHHKTSNILKTHKHSRVYYRSASADTAISTEGTTPDELVTFAKSLKGIRYRFGSSNPEKGFDCSGCVNYVFNHFGIVIPRSSTDFTSFRGKTDLKDAKFGDLILFTGTKKHTKRAGHIGIIVSLPGEPLSFIHSTSGAANGVTETALNDYYLGRYIKTIRIFSKNNDKPTGNTDLETDSR
jgi:lipoprotein Spr